MALLLVVLIIAVLVVIGIILAVTFGQRLKGNIVLSIGNSHFSPGQEIGGIVTVTAKKDLGPGRLLASLVCIEEWRESSTDANGHTHRETKTKEIYRHDVELAGSLLLNAGQQQAIPFVLPTPQPQDTVAPDGEAPGWQRALRAVADVLSADRDTYWEVTSRYDIKGLDLRTEQRIPLMYDFD